MQYYEILFKKANNSMHVHEISPLTLLDVAK